MSDTANEKNTPNFVDIPISIYTEYKTGDEITRAKLQIEQTAFHIEAIFWFLKIAARGHDLLELQTDTVLFRTNEFTGNAEFLCQIGEGLASSLEMQMRPLVNAAENSQSKMSEMPDSNKELLNEIAELGGSLSKVLKNKAIPAELYNSIKRELNDIYNNSDKQKTTLLEDSPEFIKSMLIDLKEKEASSNEK